MKIGDRPAWTFMAYLNGDSNLREEVTLDLVQLHQEGAAPNVNVVATLFRGDQRHKSCESAGPSSATAVKQDWRGHRTFVVGQSPSSTVETQASSLEDEAVSDWHTLRDFLIESMTKFPAEHYALAVAGHGNAQGDLVIDGDGKGMRAPDFQRAIAEAEDTCNSHLSLLVFEACSVGQPATMNRLNDVADFVIASPQPIETNRMPWANLLQTLKAPDLSPSQAANEWHQAIAAEIPPMQLFCAESGAKH